MERNNSDLGQKSLVASGESSLGKATATITLGQCFRTEREHNSRESAWDPMVERFREQKVESAVAVSCAARCHARVCSALPSKPIEKAIKSYRY